MPPLALIRLSLASVWIYEGLWCKILGRMPQQAAVVSTVPGLGGAAARPFLHLLGLVECALGVWVLSGAHAWGAALAQSVLLAGMNAAGIAFSRRSIHDPAGMLLKNFALLLLAWGGGCMIADTPWRAGRLGPLAGPGRLLFGRTYEDPTVEASVFPLGSRVFCIASAGCTALHLADGRGVTAVDINPIQLDYARSRAAGAPVRMGDAERLMALGRPLLRLAGWRRERLLEFLSLENTLIQSMRWKEWFDTRRFRLAIDTLLSAVWLRGFYASPYLGALPRGFGAVMRSRLERNWANHPNRHNPYARALLLGEAPAAVALPGAEAIRFECADAAAFLEACPPGSFDGFSISNILDGAPPAYAARLRSAVRRAGAPGSRLVRRSFASGPGWPGAHDLTGRDRSILWGIVEAVPTGA